MLRIVNDNKLGSHCVMVRVPIPPLKIDYPKHKDVQFKPRPKLVPELKNQPLAYNPGGKPKPSNQYTNNYMKTAYKTSTQESGIHEWFRL